MNCLFDLCNLKKVFSYLMLLSVPTFLSAQTLNEVSEISATTISLEIPSQQPAEQLFCDNTNDLTVLLTQAPSSISSDCQEVAMTNAQPNMGLTLPKMTIKSSLSLPHFSNIVGMAIDGYTNRVYTWSKNRTTIAGSTDNLNKYKKAYGYSLPPRKNPSDIIAMAIDGGKNHFSAYVWYRNGTVSAGSTGNLDNARKPYKFSLPIGIKRSDIIGMAIDGDTNHVYAWYKDGTVSAGSTRDLDKYRARYRYTLAPGKTPSDVVGMAIDGDTNHVYVWYKNGTVSAGSTNDLDKYRKPYTWNF